MYKADVIAEQQRKIRERGCKPARCYRCGHWTRYPGEEDVLNSISRFKKDVYICGICGIDEVLGDIKTWSIESDDGKAVRE